MALLVDGENVSHGLAGRMVSRALTHGDPTVMRVDGNAGLIPNWDTAERFRLIDSGTGRNSADLLPTVEAMALAHGGGSEVFRIASSGRDFSHLVLHLRERGHKVIGLGESKANPAYRKAFAKREELRAPEPAKAEPGPAAASGTMDGKIAAILQAEGGSLEIARLGARMPSTHRVKIGTRKEKTWRAYLVARPELFRCEPRGPDARASLPPPVSP